MSLGSGELLFVVLSIGIVSIPTIIAFVKGKKNKVLILIVNVVLGLSWLVTEYIFFLWLVLLVYSIRVK